MNFLVEIISVKKLDKIIRFIRVSLIVIVVENIDNVFYSNQKNLTYLNIVLLNTNFRRTKI